MHIIIFSIYLICVVVGVPDDQDGPDLLLSKPTMVCVQVGSGACGVVAAQLQPLS